MNTTETVRDIMAERPVGVAPDMDIHDAVKLLITKQLSGAPVIDETGALVGFLSEKDCFNISYCCCYFHDRGGRVSDYMTRSVVTVNAGTDIVTVAEMFLRGPYRLFPVVSRDRVVGVISRREVLKALLEIC